MGGGGRFGFQHDRNACPGSEPLTEYVCITVLSQPAEAPSAFSGRLSRFWTHMLRNFKSDFEKVYAETTEFEDQAGCLARQYLAESIVIGLLEKEFTAAGFAYEPVDRDEVYSRYEAVPPEWMQIEH
jgi:hypothetical protein